MNGFACRQRGCRARGFAWAGVLLGIAAAGLGAGAGRAAVSPLDSVIARGIKDFRGSAVLADADLDALRKCGDDYANAYRAKTMETYFKEPGRIRFEAKAIGLTFTQVVNGNTIYVRFPPGITRERDISDKPQARQNSLEIGFISPTALNDFNVKHLGTQKIAGQACHKFELRYKQKTLAKKKILLWADPAKKVLARRELYFDDGKLKARFGYSNPKQVAPGIWVPTRITVHNGLGQFGGTTTYSSIKVNTGVPDDLFNHG